MNNGSMFQALTKVIKTKDSATNIFLLKHFLSDKWPHGIGCQAKELCLEANLPREAKFAPR